MENEHNSGDISCPENDCSKDKRKSLQTVQQAAVKDRGAEPCRAALADSPEAGDHAAEQEDAVALYEGRQEGEEAVYGHADEQALPPAHLVRHAPPEEGPHHHAQVHYAA